MGRRLALIIGNSIFRDPSLARLLTPDADVGALADVLLSPEIGAFDDAKLVVNMAAASIRRSISEFFSNKTRDDLLLLYFSGHGVLDENGRLYLATKETERDYLRGTAIPAAFITDEMDQSRSRRQVLVLDCCHSGAFARGSKGAPGASVGTATAFEGKGYGRVVLTASDATQYAWEGNQVIGEADNSVFTHFLVQGLQTGKADADGDGQITVDELYDYVYEQVISQTPKQTPGKWSYREQGEIVLARALAGAPLRPEEIQLPEFDDEIETRLKRMYDTGLAAFWLDDWDRAARAFQAILDARPDYPGALEKLREARRNAELARLYQTAQDARQSQDWDAAISALEALLAQAPDYRDAASQLQTARQKAHLAELYAEARQLCRAGKWYAARRVLARIAETGPDYPDEDGLHALVEENIAALERQKKLEDLYSQALARIDSGALADAQELLSQIQELEPGYAETGRLVAKVVTLIQRQAEERQRQEQIDALYSQAIALARAEQWPEVLSKLAAIRRISPQFEDPQDLLATAERRIDLAEQESQRQAETPVSERPRPAREEVRPKARPGPAEPAKAAASWYSRPISYLRQHVWLTLSASVFIVILVLAGLNAGRIFPSAVIETPASTLALSVPTPLPAPEDTAVPARAESSPAAAPTEPPVAATEAMTEEPVEGEMPFEGETVTIFTAAGEEQLKVFEQNFVEFEARTGIDVVGEGSPDFETLSVVRAEAGDPPDIYNFPQPGLMASMARDGFLIDLGQFITQEELAQHYSQSWIDLGTVDGTLVGIWHGADVKSLVWYPKAEFEAAGYTIPETWDELIALSDQILADGTAPWCIGIEGGGSTGWPGTDWIEDIMLRTASPEQYDQWTSGELPFSSPEVKNAWEMMGEIWFKEGYVLGGTTSILSTNFGDAPLPLFDDPPSCFLHRQASFIPNFFPEGAEVGVDVDYFYLPPIDPQFGKPVLGSGNLISMGRDTPAVREVVKFLITGESVRAEVEAGNVVAPHMDASLDWYPNDITRGYAEILQGADTFRFDGSDLMPGEVGAGSFWTGVVDYVGGEDLDTVLETIDASWPGE